MGSSDVSPAFEQREFRQQPVCVIWVGSDVIRNRGISHHNDLVLGAGRLGDWEQGPVPTPQVVRCEQERHVVRQAHRKTVNESNTNVFASIERQYPALHFLGINKFVERESQLLQFFVRPA
jgi:hypothetical protein